MQKGAGFQHRPTHAPTYPFLSNLHRCWLGGRKCKKKSKKKGAAVLFTGIALQILIFLLLLAMYK